MNIGDRIKEVRKYSNMTQTEFGEKVGVKGNTIGNYELKLRNPSDAVIFSISREFNVNEDWLRTGQGDMFIELDREDEITKWLGSLAKPDDDNEFIKKFVHMLSKLEVDDWKALEKMTLLMVEESNKGESIDA